jgi:hypothetical protein
VQALPRPAERKRVAFDVEDEGGRTRRGETAPHRAGEKQANEEDRYREVHRADATTL